MTRTWEMKNPPLNPLDSNPDPFGNLSIRTARLLRGQGLMTVQLVAMYPEGLLGIRNLGFKSLREIEKHFLPGSHYTLR